jgi:hypothetical protein
MIADSIEESKDVLLTGGQQFQGGSGEASSLLQWWELTYGQPMKQYAKGTNSVMD